MKKLPVFLAIALVAALAAFGLYRSSLTVVDQVDLRLKDVRFRIRGSRKPDPHVAVVAIDNRSVKEIGRVPWSREIVAELIRKLKAYGAGVVALDMVFSEPQGARQDAALAEAIRASGNVIMGYFFRPEKQELDPRVREQLLMARVNALSVAPGVTAVPLKEYRGVDCNTAAVAEGALDHGFFNVTPDPDGIFREAPLLLLFEGNIYPCVALKALSHHMDAEVAAEVGPEGLRSVTLGDLAVPATGTGRLVVNYYGPAGSFPQVSAADVLRGRLPEGALKGRIVFVGATEMGISDIRATPFDPVLPGVEIHASIASNALQHAFISRGATAVRLEVAAMFLLPLLLAACLAAAPGTLAGLGVLAAVVSSYAGVNYYLFVQRFLDLSILFPLLPALCTYLGAEGYRNLVVERRGRYLRKAFSSYLSPDLAEEIMKNPDRLKLGGERREVSVLFSDIRSFTTLSERLSPEELVLLLNEYLSPMTRIVMEEKGTLDKYIGDAVMAIFNAPLDVPGHAGHACRAALRMMEKLRDLNADFQRRGMSAIDIGIGINTAEVVVGNMGADIRFDYTAIGDGVNLASRLEGLNKLYSSHILVSESTRTQAGEEFSYRQVDLVRVKGKNVPVAIYELLPEGTAGAMQFEEGLALYRERRFSEAQEAFRRLAEQGDGLAATYAGRCRDFLDDPPHEEWDGVYTARTK